VQPAVVTLTLPPIESVNIIIPTLPPIESVNIIIPPVAAVLESTAKAPVSDLIEDLFNRPHYDTTYPQEGDADDTDNNSSNMQDEDMAGYWQEEDMAGYGLKVPAIETRKTTEDSKLVCAVFMLPFPVRINGSTRTELKCRTSRRDPSLMNPFRGDAHPSPTVWRQFRSALGS
jgi:hypothetical protein